MELRLLASPSLRVTVSVRICVHTSVPCLFEFSGTCQLTAVALGTTMSGHTHCTPRDGPWRSIMCCRGRSSRPPTTTSVDRQAIAISAEVSPPARKFYVSQHLAS